MKPFRKTLITHYMLTRRDLLFWLAALFTLLLASIILSPLANAWFHRDDFWLITLSRYTSNPIDFWLHDHSAFYFFRPFAMSLWWYTVAWWGVEAAPHYALNALLHVLVAVTLGLWIRLFTRSWSTGFVVIVIYTAHPITVRTAMWLSDRFDLLASACVFAACALFISDPGVRWRRLILSTFR